MNVICFPILGIAGLIAVTGGASAQSAKVMPGCAPSAAGADQQVCGSSANLAGNMPDFDENGAWSVVSGSGGSFGDANSPMPTFSGTPGVTYTLRWTIVDWGAVRRVPMM